MREQLGYRIPFVLMTILGIFFAAQYYIPHRAIQGPADMMQQWKQPLGAFMIFVAAFGLIRHHVGRIRKRQARWGYSCVTVLAALAMMVAGIGFGTETGSVFADWFAHLITPIEATMFSLVAFYIASAAFRAFRARSTGTTILLASGLLVMLGMIPVVEQWVPAVSDVAAFILDYPNTAAKRAILIGIALGAISISVKTLLGIDRTILGRGTR